MDEQRGGAGDGREQDKVQDCEGARERIGNVERVWADATRRAWSGSDCLELSELVAA